MSGIEGMTNDDALAIRGYGAGPWPWPHPGAVAAPLAYRLESHRRREIAAQPDALQRTDLGLRGIALPDALAGADRLLVVAAGSSLRAAAAARGWIEQFSGLPCDVEPVGTWRDCNALPVRRTVAVLVLRSGETVDLLTTFRARGVPTVAVVNAPHASLARDADLPWPTEAGPEHGVTATKGFTVQVLALLRLALAFGAARGGLDTEARRQAERALAEAPLACALAEAAEARLAAIGVRVAGAGGAILVGSGWGAALADEAASQLRRLANVRAQAAPAGDLRDGTLALAREGVPTLVLASADQQPSRIAACAAAVRDRGGYVIALVEAACSGSLDQIANEVVALPGRGLAQIFAQAVAGQLIAWHAALALGRDLDQPANPA